MPHGTGDVRITRTKGRWARRVIAVAAAYAIVIASLFANFAAARAAAGPAAGLDAVICHAGGAAAQSPAGNPDKGNPCSENCCIGCLTLLAAVPPPTGVAAIRYSAGLSIERFITPLIVGHTAAKSNKSRAPPQSA